MRDRMIGIAGKRRNRDEDELRKAIEESKKALAKERRDAEEREFQQALRLFEEEEVRRKPGGASNNPFPLVDPTPYATGLQPQFTTVQPQFTSVQPQFTSFNPYHQQAEQGAAQVLITQTSSRLLIIDEPWMASSAVAESNGWPQLSHPDQKSSDG